MNKNITGERISELLNKKEMTQRELAKRAGVTEVSMSRYISGERVPKALYLSNIAHILGTTTEYLLGKEEAGASAQDDFYTTHKLIARSASTWTPEQKSELAKTLFES